MAHARGPVLVLLTLASIFAAGCATNPSPIGDADAAHAGISCPAGSSVSGFNAAGAPACAPPAAPPPLHAGFSCPPGEFVQGFDDAGRPRCALPSSGALPSSDAPPQRAQGTHQEATREVASNLVVTGIYGVRNSTSLDLWDLKMNVELSAGAVPMDLTRLVIRYSDGTTTRNYARSPAPLADAAPPSASFNATWIRGEGADALMRSGDLVQLHFNLVSRTLAPRTYVETVLVPETGEPVAASFKTPATYSTYTIVTLR